MQLSMSGVVSGERAALGSQASQYGTALERLQLRSFITPFLAGVNLVVVTLRVAL